MIKLIRFGKRVINMAQIVEIEYHPAIGGICRSPECYRLYTNQIVDGLPSWLEIDGADIIAFEQWLQDNSDNARASMESDEEAQP